MSVHRVIQILLVLTNGKLQGRRWLSPLWVTL